MAHNLTLRGVPQAIRQDAWWLSQPAGAERAGGTVGVASESVARPPRGAAMLALVATADILFYGHVPGLSLAAFAAVVFTIVALSLPHRHEVLRPAILLVVTCLPSVEYIQTLSVLFFLFGLLTSISWMVQGPAATIAEVMRGAGVLLRRLPWLGVRDLLWSAPGVIASGRSLSPPIRFIRGWAFPLGGTLILMALVIEANPVFEGWILAIADWSFDPMEWIVRAVFWSGVALLVWPLLAGSAQTLGAGRGRVKARRFALGAGLGINGASVANALIAFNLVLGLQSLTDIGFLWGGADLPEGMSLASYAHRGAYPLLVTALLAGAFALAARPLMALWLLQNVLLVASAARRLSIYIEVFGPTYLRVHAAIWMAMVAIGLVLVGWQIFRARSNLWLLLRSAGLSVGVLYVSCFVNFAHLIAAANLSRAGWADCEYACGLGPMAAAIADVDTSDCEFIRPKPIRGWRDWGFRTYRVSRYLEAYDAERAALENPGN